MLKIKNFTFNDFISQLKGSEDRLDALIEHIDEDPSNMTIDEKINRVLELVYIDLVNNKMQMFMTMTEHAMDDFLRFGGQLGFLPSGAEEKIKALEKTDDIRKKFLNYVIKYKKIRSNFLKMKLKNLIMCQPKC